MLHFKMTDKELENLSKFVPDGVFSDEAMQFAAEMLNTIERYKDDGPRVVPELVSSLEELAAKTLRLRGAVEAGLSFAEREAARIDLEATTENYEDTLRITMAVLCDLRINPADVMIDPSHYQGLLMPPAARQPVHVVGLYPAFMQLAQTNPISHLLFVRTRFGFLILLLVVSYIVSKVAS